MAYAGRRISPLLDRILVQKVKPQTNYNGIVLPEASTPKLNEGIVLAVGPGMYRDGQFIKPSVKENDRVLLAEYGGTELKVGKESVHIYREEDILAVLSGQ